MVSRDAQKLKLSTIAPRIYRGTFLVPESKESFDLFERSACSKLHQLPVQEFRLHDYCGRFIHINALTWQMFTHVCPMRMRWIGISSSSDLCD